MPEAIRTYAQAMAALNALELRGMVLGLERVERLLDRLGRPHERFRSVHLAGTNGKGSTAAYLERILRAAGRAVGRYTSPHLERFPERITVRGREIGRGEVARGLREVLDHARSLGPGFRPTYFEVTTALAFSHFARAGVEIAVVEAGLGGRLDATNVVRPDVAVITNVAREHTDLLGGTVEAIAREKAGIVKPGADVVTAARGRAAEVIEAACREAGCRCLRAGREFAARGAVRLPEGGWRFGYRGTGTAWEDLRVRLRGSYQVGNAALALAAVECLRGRGVEVPDAAVRRGLAAAEWPGRMEVLGRGPRVVLDGAHNPHAVAALVRTLEEEFSYRRLIVVAGVLREKEIGAVVGPLAERARAVVAVRPASGRAAAAEEVARAASAAGAWVTTAGTIPEALEAALGLAGADDLVVVAGSLYLVGEARSWLRGRGGAA